MTNNLVHPPLPSLNYIASKHALLNAWKKVRANRGAAGVDAISIQAFESDLDRNLLELSRTLINRTYEPLPLKMVSIPKPDGFQRELAIPCVRDRIAQRAVMDAIEPLLEPRFLDCSYAFRPGRSVELALEKLVVLRAQGLCWTLKADIHNFFPSIDRDFLIEQLSALLPDDDLLSLVRKWLEAGALACPQSATEAPWQNYWYSTVAELKLAIKDAIDSTINNYANSNLTMPAAEYASDASGHADYPHLDTFPLQEVESEFGVKPRQRRAIIRRLIESGMLLAITERALLLRLGAANLLGIGGASAVALLLMPAIVRKIRNVRTAGSGAPQGSPLSPLLSNLYLHKFDEALTNSGFKLIRYCDDFVIPCRTKTDCQTALKTAKKALAALRLHMRPEKILILPPASPFVFLGNQFTSDGRILPPPSLPAATLKRIALLSSRSTQVVRLQTATAVSRSRQALARVFNWMASRLEQEK